MSPLVTHGDPAVHSRGWPPATPSPGRHARGPGSSSGSALWPASASGSPLCSPCGRPVSSSTAGAAHCGGPGETIAGSSDTYVVFASSSAGILQPPIMRASTPDRDVRRRRAEENEETFIGSFWKKTPPKKTTVSHRWNDYTFRSVMAARTGALRQSILKKAFSGQLVQQDPTDEPASALLARIRPERNTEPSKRSRRRAEA